MRWLLVLLMMTAAVSCGHPDNETCLRVCWRFAELNFWEKFDAETKGLDPEAKATARAEREKLWNELKNREHNPGLDNCVTSCRQAGKRSDVVCIDKAKTAAEARACKIDE